MSLFSQRALDIPVPWINYIGQGTIEELLDDIDSLRLSNVLYPAKGQELSIFHKILPSDVKVVILSQNPYADANANGVAFSCQHWVSTSIRQLYFAITEDPSMLTCNEDDFPHDMTLTTWINQGVLLTNVTYIS